MLEVIVACDKSNGIGKNNVLPWQIKEEIQLFKYKTQNSVLVVGNNTYKTLPYLTNRLVLVLSKNCEKKENVVRTIEEAIHCAQQNNEQYSKIFIIGGAQIYHLVFQHYFHLISKVHVSFIDGNYNCDTFFPIPDVLKDMLCTSKQNYAQFEHREYEPKTICGEIQYLKLLKETLIFGSEAEGRNGVTLSTFGKSMKFNLQQEFPLLTTKKMFLRGIVEELLFFLRGQTDSKILEAKNVNIWRENTKDTNGFMGPMYGSQWRSFNADISMFNPATSLYKGGYDQLSNVIHLLKTDRKSRRILMTTFNPAQAHLGVLYPCHSIVNQFYVENDEFLDMTCYNRSSDLFLGLPFNIASSSLLLMIIAEKVNLKPRFLHLFLGDCHIYESHVDAVKTQLQRIPKTPPTLKIETFESLQDLEYEKFSLFNYVCDPAIKAEMVK